MSYTVLADYHFEEATPHGLIELSGTAGGDFTPQPGEDVAVTPLAAAGIIAATPHMQEPGIIADTPETTQETPQEGAVD